MFDKTFIFEGDNLVSMLLKPSYTTQESEKVYQYFILYISFLKSIFYFSLMMILMVEFWLEITLSQERYYSHKNIFTILWPAFHFYPFWPWSKVCPLDSEIRINSTRNGQYNDQTFCRLRTESHLIVKGIKSCFS